MFSYTEGPLLIYLETGEIVGVSSDESKSSIVIWLEKDIEGNVHNEDIENDKELFPISCDDDKYCSGLWSSIAGNKIERVFIIKRNPQNVNYEELPNEVGLQLTMKNGDEYILSHQLCGKNSNFSVGDKEGMEEEILNELAYIELAL